MEGVPNEAQLAAMRSNRMEGNVTKYKQYLVRFAIREY